MHATQNGSLQAIKFDPYGMVVLVHEDHGRPELPCHTYERTHALCTVPRHGSPWCTRPNATYRATRYLGLPGPLWTIGDEEGVSTCIRLI
jgi:hypothetical protein